LIELLTVRLDSLGAMVVWITGREAAQILGVHISAIPKMVRRGDLEPRRGRPSLRREDVETLRDRRAAPKPPRARKPAPQPPDAEHDWLTSTEAAALMAVGRTAVNARARRGKMPGEIHDGRRWFRRDHLELVKRADAVRRGQTTI
jgi:hypothetical protein